MNTDIFNVNTSLVSKKKIRGKKGYYRRLQENAEQFSIIEEPEHWFDYWHYHIESNSISNLGWGHRKLHLNALFTIFHRLAEETKILKIPFQLWLQINEKNGYNDCILLHTPNPQSEFPCVLNNVKWGQKYLEKHFQEHLAPYNIRAGISYNEDEKQNCYFIYSPSLGEPLE